MDLRCHGMVAGMGILRTIQRWKSVEVFDTLTSLGERFGLERAATWVLLQLGGAAMAGLGGWAAQGLFFGFVGSVCVYVMLWVAQREQARSGFIASSPLPISAPNLAGNSTPVTSQPCDDQVAVHAALVERVAGLDHRVQKIDSIIAEMATQISQVEERVRDRLDGTRDGIIDSIKDIRKGLGSLQTQQKEFERQITDLLRARDANRRMKYLAGEIDHRFDRLVKAQTVYYPNGPAWKADYENWKLFVEEFYSTIARWAQGIVDPFGIQDDRELDDVNVPEGELLSSFENQQRYRRLVIAGDRYFQIKTKALDFIATKATPD
ncbi:hypothetical protein [Muricoccus nepalensis]|uniref:hypothetical protein n=1 Tax=Muricoccus nepalensis TaxID=1854500 RepID=UPI00112AAF15|nr:hypothetical protein [Roseomonas nepalensis]